MYIPEFIEIDGDSSTISNFMKQDVNWENLKKYLTALQEQIGNIEGGIDIETIIQRVLERMSSIKIKLTLDPNQDDYTLNVNGVVYRLTKIDNDTIRIKKNDVLDVWDLSQSLFRCSDQDGNVVYPKIKIILNGLEISFNDWRNTTIYDFIIM